MSKSKKQSNESRSAKIGIKPPKTGLDDFYEQHGRHVWFELMTGGPPLYDYEGDDVSDVSEDLDEYDLDECEESDDDR